MRPSRWVLRVVVAVGAVAWFAAVPWSPARAAVTSINPSSARVNPGEGASATVSVRGVGVHCLEVRVTPEHPTVRAVLAPTTCDDEEEWNTGLAVSTTSQTPSGTYLVEVRDRDSGVTFRLEVATPPPPPTTTITPPPTTTTQAPTTTAAPTTTTTTPPPPPSTTTTTTTTTEPPPPVDSPFVAVSALVDQAIPSEGLFLPLTDPSYQTCLPLTKACAGPGDALVLVPARGAEVRWTDPPVGVAPPPALADAGVPNLQPVGIAPADPANRTYVLFVLDLVVPGGQVAALPRGLDSQGELSTRTKEHPVAVPAAEGVEIAEGPRTFVGGTPFAKPYRISSQGLTEASPALAFFSTPVPRLLFGVRADPAWGLNQEFVPLLGNGTVPYLVRGPAGPPGLFVPVPEGLQLASEPSEPDGDVALPEKRTSPLALAGLGLAILALAGGLGVLLWRRRAEWL